MRVNLGLDGKLCVVTGATRERMAEMAVDNLLAGLRGERMPNQVN